MAGTAERRPAALLWDVDGTLAETEEHGHRIAFNRAFAEAGLPWRWDPPTYRRLLAVSGGRERLTAFLTEAEGAPPAAGRVAAFAARKQVHYAALVRGGDLPLREGVEDLVREAAAAGLPQAIVTTSSREAVKALREGPLAPVAEAFAFWICGEDVAAKKPDPEAYRQAVDRLGLGPERVLAIEDSLHGLAAATGAGLPCLVTLSSQSLQEPPPAFAAACAVVASLGDAHRAPAGHRTPACPEGAVTLSWLERLLAAP